MGAALIPCPITPRRPARAPQGRIARKGAAGGRLSGRFPCLMRSDAPFSEWRGGVR